MQYLQPFKHTLSNGKQLFIETAVCYYPPLNFEDAASRDDAEYDLDVVDLLILDRNGVNVTDKYRNLVPDSVFIREIELTAQEEVDLTQLTFLEGYEDYEA